MARHVFFSFHYQDVADFRANVVRNSWRTKDRSNEEVFYDGSIWEEAKLKGVKALKNLISKGLKNTSVTTVLIGKETHNRNWVKYEIFKSFEDGNGLLGVYLNRIRGKNGRIESKGSNPFDRLGIEVSADGRSLYLYELIKGSWSQFKDLPVISNKRSNTIYFDNGGWFRESSWNKFFKLSELFPIYCWINDNGYDKFSDWVELAFEESN